MIQDKELIKKRFAANFRQYDLLAHTQQAICAELAVMMEGIPAPAHALEVGTGTGFLTRRLTAAYPSAHWTLNDLTEASQPYLEACLHGVEHRFVWGDAETADFPCGLGLIASASTVQWFDDLPRFIRRCAGATLPGGHIALTSFGERNFHEIKIITGQGLDYHTLPQIETMLAEAGYRVVRSREYTRQLGFGSPAEVLRHIKATGVNSIHRAAWTRRSLADFETRYRSLFPLPGGQVSLTYHPILLTAIKLT